MITPTTDREEPGVSTTALAGGSRRGPYLWVSACVMAWAVLAIAHGAWGGDFDLHMATVWALILDPWSPADPMVGGAADSAYFTPYIVTLALIARSFEIFPFHLFQVAALANVSIFLWGFGRFCRHFGPNRWIPVVALFAAGLISGIESPSWSGFLDVGSLFATLPYPSFLANALMFLVWDAFLSYRNRPIALQLVTVSVLAGLTVLIHPFTGLNMALGLVAFFLADIQRWGRRAVLNLALGVALSLTIVVVWPYFDARMLFTHSSDGYDLAGVHAPLVELMTSHWGLGAYGLALLGLPALVLRVQRRLGREMVALAILASALVGLGTLAGSYELSRIIPVALLPMQLSLAVFLVEEYVGGPDRRIRLYAAVSAIAALAGLYGGRYALSSAWPPRLDASPQTGWWHETRLESLDGVEKYLDPGDVAIVDTGSLGRGLNSLGVHTIEHHMMYPFADDEPQRRASSAEFFSRVTSPTERGRIADQYGVVCVVAPRNRWIIDPREVDGFTTAHDIGKAGRMLCR
jgi:hypothetical protein